MAVMNGENCKEVQTERSIVQKTSFTQTDGLYARVKSIAELKQLQQSNGFTH